MRHTNRTWTYVMIGIAALALALAFGFNPGFLVVLLICPLMMFFMMRGMSDMGSGHDRTDSKDTDDRSTAPRS